MSLQTSRIQKVEEEKKIQSDGDVKCYSTPTFFFLKKKAI